MKNYLFQSCAHCWLFQICWHIECSTLTASLFRIWNGSAGIPSLPQALFIVMFPKVHVTSHSRMSDSRWVTTSSWLFGSIRPFLLVLLCILATSYFLLLLLDPYCFCPLSCLSMHHVPLISPIFLKRSLIFPILLFSSISLHCSFKAFLSLLAIPWSSAFSCFIFLFLPWLSLFPFLSYL